MKQMRAKLSSSLLKRQGDRTESRYARLGLITGSVMRVSGGDCPVGWCWYSLGEERWASSGGEAGGAKWNFSCSVAAFPAELGVKPSSESCLEEHC